MEGMLVDKFQFAGQTKNSKQGGGVGVDNPAALHKA